jgi:hypothetical protein
LSHLYIFRYLTPVSETAGSLFVGKLDTSMVADSVHEYVPNLAAQGSGYTFSDRSGVALRLLGCFNAGREEQKAIVVDALKAITREKIVICSLICFHSWCPVGMESINKSRCRWLKFTADF